MPGIHANYVVQRILENVFLLREESSDDKLGALVLAGEVLKETSEGEYVRIISLSEDKVVWDSRLVVESIQM